MKITNKKVEEVLVNIHRGFLPDRGKEYTDKEILEQVPPNTLSWKPIGGERILVSSPFTFKWVKKRLKKNPNETAYEMLVDAGFKEQADGL